MQESTMAADSGSPGDDTYTQINACIQKVATGPIRGREKTHLMTGHVHKPYPRIYVLLARLAGFDSAAIIRGVEGGGDPLAETARRGHCLPRGRGSPGIRRAPGRDRDALVYAAAIMLRHLGRYNSLSDAGTVVRETLDSGKALAHFRACAVN